MATEGRSSVVMDFARRFFEDQYFQKQARIEEAPATPVEPWPVEYWQQITKRAIASDQLARKSYDKLLQAGVRSPDGLQMAIGMAATAPERGGRQDWLSGSGKTSKTLTYFPGRLRCIAGEIERLNRHSLLRPDTWVSGRGFSELEERIFSRWFVRLPVLLSRYADFVEAQSKHLKRGGRNDMRPRALARSMLIDYVRGKTGKPMLNDLANLLDAAARIAGTSHTVDQPTLKQLDFRKRKKTRLTRGGLYLPLIKP